MLFIILIQALLMLALKGTDGQEIAFDPLRLTSPCSEGLRSGADIFTLTGTVGRNFSALVNSDWIPFVTVSVSSSKLIKTCNLLIGPDGLFCNSTSTKECYCHHINTTTGSAHFVVNYTAQEDFSGGVIEAQWKHQNSTVVRSHNNITLPTIYDVNKASVTIKVNDEPAKEISAHFEVNLVPNKTNTVELCCTNTASPCYPRMLLNGQVFENQTSNCVSFTVFQPNNYIANVTSLYSVCSTQNSDYITAGVVVITTGEQNESSNTTESETTTTTAAVSEGTTEVTTELVPSTSSATTSEKPGSDKPDIPLIVCTSIIIPIVVIALIVVAVYCYKKNKKKSKAVTNGGPNESGRNENNEKQELHETDESTPKDRERKHHETKESTPKDNEQKQHKTKKSAPKPQEREHQEQDGQPSAGYINRGFETTSASDITIGPIQDNSKHQHTVQEKNGNNKGKTNGSASKDTSDKTRQLPPLRGTQKHDYLQQPSGRSRPVSVEMTSSAKN